MGSARFDVPCEAKLRVVEVADVSEVTLLRLVALLLLD
jgi:hypothetical protein